jgi:hypothetical protein
MQHDVASVLCLRASLAYIQFRSCNNKVWPQCSPHIVCGFGQFFSHRLGLRQSSEGSTLLLSYLRFLVTNLRSSNPFHSSLVATFRLKWILLQSLLVSYDMHALLSPSQHLPSNAFSNLTSTKSTISWIARKSYLRMPPLPCQIHPPQPCCFI